MRTLSRIEAVPVSESMAVAETAAAFYADDPAIAFMLGRKNGLPHRRLAMRNCVVTSDMFQTIYSYPSRKAFVHVAEAGTWGESLHQFVLRGTMKIPFVIDSGTIERLHRYREACQAAVPEGISCYILAAYSSEGSEGEASELLAEVCGRVGSCCSVVHTDREERIFEDAGFVRDRDFEFEGVPCRLMLRAG
ncbi:MAG: hypothetical protein IKQ60_01670 [Candidatus Methanomethylophilaceae archaeon]|nr:hypothetical protein [Candidatus Methanomethylophilaceae archaeon]